jgi:hypothetical protein
MSADIRRPAESSGFLDFLGFLLFHEVQDLLGVLRGQLVHDVGGVLRRHAVENE